MTNFKELLQAQKEALQKDDKEINDQIIVQELELEKLKETRSEILRALRVVEKKLEKLSGK